MINVTEAAASKIAELLTEENKLDASKIRVATEVR